MTRNENLIEKPYYKPKSFDSLSNIQPQNRLIDYKQYLGYKLYFKPQSNKYTSSKVQKQIDFLTTDKKSTIIKSGKIPFNDIVIYKSFNGGKGLSDPAKNQYQRALKQYEDLDKLDTNIYLPEFIHSKTDPTDGVIYGSLATKKNEVEGKYFTILEVEGKDKYSGDKKFKKLVDLSNDLSTATVAELRIKLKNDKTNDTLYWNVSEARSINSYPFILVPYFEKAKKDFVGQDLIATKSLSNLVNNKTGDIVNITPDQKWFCEDLSLTETNKDKYLKPLYYLTNQNNTIVLDIEQLRDSFITETKFKKIQEEKKRAEAEKAKQQKEQEQRQITEAKEFKQFCINKYGAKTGSLISENKVAVGMTKEMCKLAWGEPLDINRITMKGFAHEQWVYGFGTYLYFDNGILTTIQD